MGPLRARPRAVVQPRVAPQGAGARHRRSGLHGDRPAHPPRAEDPAPRAPRIGRARLRLEHHHAGRHHPDERRLRAPHLRLTTSSVDDRVGSLQRPNGTIPARPGPAPLRCRRTTQTTITRSNRCTR
ncbi:hypothetical protein FRIGORI9N_330030 [Frigoribacterium sp. 9N]|nr:hypothetical protein FRIGORI9N_330030 [Frigoribacterium sp. 9N]